MDDIDIPEVLSYQQHPRFFAENGKHYVEISSLGLKDTIIHKVTPELMARFRPAWDAYCDGRPVERRTGTPLTDLKDISADMAEEYVRRNVHTLEELAVLNDIQCQGLGHGLINLRRRAQAIIAQRKFAHDTKLKDRINEESAKTQPAPEVLGDVAELRAAVEEQGKQIAALVAALTPKKKPAKKKPIKGTHGTTISPGDSEPGV